MTITLDNKDEKAKKVFTALQNSKYTWRTIRGTARETGLEREEVESIILEKSEQIARSSYTTPKGEFLYTTKERFKSFASPLEKIGGALRNRLN